MTKDRSVTVARPPEDSVDVPLVPLHVQRAIYAVAGGNHVMLLLDRRATSAALDVIEVRAAPGGGPPPHRHAFGEWFRVLAGELTICENRNGTVRCTSVLKTGDSVWVPPWTYHGTLNLSDATARFQVIGSPGAMTGYFRRGRCSRAGRETPPTREPPGPAALVDVSARWGIQFWTGPTDFTPISA